MNNKGFASILILISLIALGAIGVAYYEEQKGLQVSPINNQQKTIVGNDRDEHGCIGSAGYSWCESKKKCLRIWEEKCEVNSEIKNTDSNGISQIRESGDDINGTHIGFIKNIENKNGKNFLTVDYVKWVYPCEPDVSKDYCLNGYSIENTNSKLRVFPLSDDAEINLQTYSHNQSGGYNWNQSVSLPEFKNTFITQGLYPVKNLLYWITLKNGEVIKISEQYQP